MNKKGFTLIELLAIIVVLILIALIAVPIVTNISKNAKKSAAVSNTYNYLNALEGNGIENLSNGTYDISDINIEVKGKKPTSGTINIKKGSIESATICINNYSVHYDGKTAEVQGPCSNSQNNSTVKYKETLLNGTDPVLKGDMVPVTISNDGTVKKADITEEWYKYSEKKWANAVVLVDNTTYEADDTIPENKIKAYYVWIPRYKYKLFDNATESTIDIVFEDKNTAKSEGTQIGEYRSHPAFTYGDKELNGIWVGKFEPSVITTDPCYTNNTKENCNKELTDVRIKANVYSLDNQAVAKQYLTSLNFSEDSKMMKNVEWGAVTYLSHSIYGINGKVRRNNNSVSNRNKTGCGAGDNAGDVGSSTDCQIAFGNASTYPQSTTGNITGIFDMGGGSIEYMMSVLANENGVPYSGMNNKYNSGFNGPFGCTTCTNGNPSGIDSSIKELTSGINFPPRRDYDLYYNYALGNSSFFTKSIYKLCNKNICYGQALSETTKTTTYDKANDSWYGEFNLYLGKAVPWIIRGGSAYGASDNEPSGIFTLSKSPGDGTFAWSFRVVVR